MPNRLRDMVFDEVSLVFKGANQLSRVAIAKSADGVEQEDSMGYTDQDGNPIDVDQLAEGDIVFDEAGNGYIYSEQDDEDDSEPEYEDDDTQEMEPVAAGKVGKSWERVQPSGRSFEADVRSALSKALTDDDRNDVIAKAAGYIEHLEGLVSKAQDEVAAERDIRRETEYLEIAKSYAGLPVSDEELAATLWDCADNLDNRSIVVLQKCLAAASDAALLEVGSSGGGFNSDVMSVIEEHANSSFAKSADTESRETQIAKTFEADPSLYEQYLQETGGYNQSSNSFR